MSTIGLEGTARCMELAEQHRVAFVDAPVLGTKQPAEEGSWPCSRPAGGRARPLRTDLRSGRSAHRPARRRRTGHEAKARREQLDRLVRGGARRDDRVAEVLEVDPELFLETIAGGALDSAYAQAKGKAMIEGEFPASFSLKLALKDAELVREAAAARGVDLPMIDAVVKQFDEERRAGPRRRGPGRGVLGLGAGLAGRPATGCFELPRDDVPLVGKLQSPLEDGNRLVGPAGEPERAPQVVERVCVREIGAVLRERSHCTLEKRDRLRVAPCLHQLEPLVVELRGRSPAGGAAARARGRFAAAGGRPCSGWPAAALPPASRNRSSSRRS